jgi:hypothetical protein
MNIASIFNYFEAALWFGIALTLFLRRNADQVELKKLAVILSFGFFAFGISDIVEASTGAWWRPFWLLILKGVCILVFIYCWIRYLKMKAENN